MRQVALTRGTYSATGYFHNNETMYVHLDVIHDQTRSGTPVADEFNTSLLYSFIASGGVSIDLNVTYYVWWTDASGRQLNEPGMDLVSVDIINSSSSDAPVSAASVLAQAQQYSLGGNVQKDGNITVVLDSKSFQNSFGSHMVPQIRLRAAATAYNYSYSFLLPFGLAFTATGVPSVFFGWRKRSKKGKNRFK